MISSEVQRIIDGWWMDGYDLEPPNPWLTILYMEALRTKNVLELGISKGRSTRTILYALKSIHKWDECHLTSVDDGVRSWATKITTKWIINSELKEYFTWVERDFFDMPDEWFKDRVFDLIYIDYDNFNDYHEILRKCSLSMVKGSILLFHNVTHFNRASVAFQQFAKSDRFKCDIIQTRYGMGRIEKME